MATIPIKPSPDIRSETLEEKFRRLAGTWQGETAYFSSMEDAERHPAYQEIIRLGPEVLPLLLRDLAGNHTHWFGALEAITGARPVPHEDAGKVEKMAEAWLHWAKENGCRW